jgi:menaquinone-dependent protoporphyrinogen IX oxidase
MNLVAVKIITMKGIVVYKSKYGATRQYAQWIANDLNFPAVDVAVLDKEKLQSADIVVIGSSVYIGKAIIRRWLRINKKLLAGKQVFLFLVCGTPVNKRDQLEKYLADSVPAEIRNTGHFFFLPGKMEYKQLSWLDRFLLQSGARLMKKDGEKNILQDYNEVARKNVNDLVAAVQHVMISHNGKSQEPQTTSVHQH